MEMESVRIAYLWLLEWKVMRENEELREAWKRLPKGTCVYLVSQRWLEHFWEVIHQVQASPGSDVLSSLFLDNSDILQPDIPQTKLLPGLGINEAYTLVPETAFNRIFRPYIRNERDVIQGWVAWNGSFQPYLHVAGSQIACFLCFNRRTIKENVEVSGNESVFQVLQRVGKLWEDATEAPELWGMDMQHDLSQLQSDLTDYVSNQLSYLRRITVSDSRIFTVLNLPLIIVEYRSNLAYSPYVQNRYGLGLENIGNTCFLNATLQCLLHIPQFANYYHPEIRPFQSDRKSFADLISVLVEKAYNQEKKIFRPEAIYNKLCEVHNYTRKEQEDANELFHLILDLLHKSESVREAKIDLDSIPMEFAEVSAWVEYAQKESVIRTEVFGGQQRQKLQCSCCQFTQYRYSPFYSLPLDLPASKLVNVALVRMDVQSPTEILTFESNTPLEDNEIMNNIRELVNHATKINNLIVGENRHMLLEGSIGLSNLVSSNSFIALEIPTQDPNSSVILVDFIHACPRGEDPICTRVLSVHVSTPLETLISDVIHYLVQVETQASKWFFTGYIPWGDSRKGEEAVFMSYKDDGKLILVSLDGSSSANSCYDGSLLKTPGMTVGDLCLNAEGQIPRFRFTSAHFSSAAVSLLKVNLQNTSRWRSLFARPVDSNLTVTLLQLLEYTVKDKPLNEENKLKCQHCGRWTQHITAMQIDRFPRILPFALQRVRMQPNGLEKSAIQIQYPILGLDLSPFETGTTYDAPIYDLKAVINHSGSSLLRGHYTAYALSPITGKWVKYNDTSVEEVLPIEAIQGKGAYMLFYSRRL